MKAEVSKLMYEGKQVGIRVIFISDVRGKITPYRDISTDICKEVVSILKENIKDITLKSEPINGKYESRSNSIRFECDRYSQEVSDLNVFVNTIKFLQARDEAMVTVMSDFKHNIRTDILNVLRRKGIELAHSSEELFDTEDACYSCRFLGGYSAWSCEDEDEDICDADVLSNEICKVLHETIKAFNAKHHVEAYFLVDEKAWVYIYIN